MSNKFRTFRAVQPKNPASLSPEMTLKLRAENLGAARRLGGAYRLPSSQLYFIPRSSAKYSLEEILGIGAKLRARSRKYY